MGFYRHFLIKPSSGSCNMRCSYCFYADEMNERTMRNYGSMSFDTSHAIIDRAFEDMEGGTLSFAFQGGEPTLRGLEFYRDFVRYVDGNPKRKHFRVAYSIQTNGLLLDDAWGSFFHDNQFLVGISMDGYEEIHDAYRKMPDGSGTFNFAIRATKTLNNHQVEFNILSTVNNLVAKDPEGVYGFFKKNGFRFLQFIPCIDFISATRGTLPWSLSAKDYGKFLSRLFDLYYKDWREGDYVSIRYFDNLVGMLAGGRVEECGLSGTCGEYLLVEADGSVYPCDFYVLDAYYLGNINNDRIAALDDKRKEIGFIEKSRGTAPECRACGFYWICRGGCRRDREDFSSGELKRTYLCEAYKLFFDSSIQRLCLMAREEMEMRLRRSSRG